MEKAFFIEIYPYSLRILPHYEVKSKILLPSDENTSFQSQQLGSHITRLSVKSVGLDL